MSNGSGVKVHPRKMKKPSTGLDDALESLQSEPSGWGDLPSPKPSDADNGTEIWGVAPDDMHRKPKSSNGTLKNALMCFYSYDEHAGFLGGLRGAFRPPP